MIQKKSPVKAVERKRKGRQDEDEEGGTTNSPPKATERKRLKKKTKEDDDGMASFELYKSWEEGGEGGRGRGKGR